MTDSGIVNPAAIALVTGASSGIGKAIAGLLLSRGVRVICVARRLDVLDELFARHGNQALTVSLDVTDADAVTAFAAGLPAEWRVIDIAVVNAGSDVGGRQPFVEGDMGDWQSSVDTNITGLMRICRAVLPGMLARDRGHLVTMGSIAGCNTYAGGAVYSATKHAVRAFTESLRKEHKNSAVRITEILPGLVRTGFAEARFGGDRDKANAFYDSFADALSPQDIANAVMYALDAPAHVNISQMVVVPTGDK